MEEYQCNQFKFNANRGKWPKSNIIEKCPSPRVGRNSLSVVAPAPLGRLGGLGCRACRSDAGGVKKSTSPSRSGRGRHLGVRSKFRSGSVMRSDFLPLTFADHQHQITNHILTRMPSQATQENGVVSNYFILSLVLTQSVRGLLSLVMEISKFTHLIQYEPRKTR